uniref:Uncharacterized protein n=1 Tax=Mycena chlorophos TaxID=658473 RepID=A0ABQ0KX39_MYCCL|nr:predicted protein [Mycena chlorophos]
MLAGLHEQQRRFAFYALKSPHLYSDEVDCTHASRRSGRRNDACCWARPGTEVSYLPQQNSAQRPARASCTHPYLRRLRVVSDDSMAGKALEVDAMHLVGTLRTTHLALDGLGLHPHTSNPLPNAVSAQHRRGAARHVRVSGLIVESRACRARSSSHAHTRCAESRSGAARFALGTAKALSLATLSPRQSIAALSVLEDGTAHAIDGGDVAIEEGTRGVAQWARAKSGWCLVCRHSLTEPMAGEFLWRVGRTTVNADAVPQAQ